MKGRLNVRQIGLTLIAAGCLLKGPETWATAGADFDWRSAESRVMGDLCDTADRDFDGFRYEQKIPHCRRNVSVETKREIAHDFGIFGNYQQFEIDHYIPLSIGGSNEPANLWPLPVPVARAKCELEGRVHTQVVKGELTQEEAIERVKSWKSFISVK